MIGLGDARLELQDPWSGILSRTVLRDPTLELDIFKSQLRTFLFVRY